MLFSGLHQKRSSAALLYLWIYGKQSEISALPLWLDIDATFKLSLSLSNQKHSRMHVGENFSFRDSIAINKELLDPGKCEIDQRGYLLCVSFSRDSN